MVQDKPEPYGTHWEVEITDSLKLQNLCARDGIYKVSRFSFSSAIFKEDLRY